MRRRSKPQPLHVSLFFVSRKQIPDRDISRSIQKADGAGWVKQTDVDDPQVRYLENILALVPQAEDIDIRLRSVTLSLPTVIHLNFMRVDSGTSSPLWVDGFKLNVEPV
jgi:hypothetical protein